jgi:hypothetical protein
MSDIRREIERRMNDFDEGITLVLHKGLDFLWESLTSRRRFVLLMMAREAFKTGQDPEPIGIGEDQDARSRLIFLIDTCALACLENPHRVKNEDDYVAYRHNILKMILKELGDDVEGVEIESELNSILL